MPVVAMEVGVWLALALVLLVVPTAANAIKAGVEINAATLVMG